MRKIFALLFITLPLTLNAQISRLGEDVQYMGAISGTVSKGDFAPFWFTSNKYGLSTSNNNSGILRAAIQRDADTDSLRNWKLGYGADIATSLGMGNRYFIVQQLYADTQWKMLRLSLGQKERPLELKNQILSSGALTSGINSRPIPQVRLEIPDFWEIPGTKGFLNIKAHIAYGLYTDNQWQRKFVQKSNDLYTKNSWFHSKAIFLRIGNYRKLPLAFTGGWEMSCQFMGKGYNIMSYDGKTKLQNVDLGGSFLSALIPGVDKDVNDDAFANAAGNHIGSYHFRLDWKKKNWSFGIYMEHMFEDESQMFMQYGFWKDMLLGLELNLPKNPIISAIVYEHNDTRNQTGPIFHDATPENDLQISAKDAYYDNHVYGSWQQGGFNIGSALIPSPIYSSYLNGYNSLHQYFNRMEAHHIGIAGNPTDQWAWRALYTHEKNLGSYDKPTKDPLYGDLLLLEATYNPKWRKELSFTASYGMNHGSLIGKSNGAMLTIAYKGWLQKSW